MTRAGEQTPARTASSRWRLFMVALTMALLAVFAVAQMSSAAEHCAPAAAVSAEDTHTHAAGHEHATVVVSVSHQPLTTVTEASLAASALSVCGAMILLLVGLALARLLRRRGQSLLTVLPRSLIPQPRLLLPQRPPWALSLNQLAISRT